MIHLVQISDGTSRRVALVEEPRLRCLLDVQSVYDLTLRCLASGRKLDEQALALAQGEILDYDAIYAATSEWHLLTPIDMPGDPSRVIVAGTGLTHLGSAKDRQAMHGAEKISETMTDSMKMFEWGVEGGRPPEGKIGTAPEWFYKGTGTILRAPFAPLTVPAYAEDGGEEAEIAGIYIVGEDGTPYRLGMAAGNEFSDHQFEKRNYLNLAGSKLRTCSLGPELVVGAQFQGGSDTARDPNNLVEDCGDRGIKHVSQPSQYGASSLQVRGPSPTRRRSCPLLRRPGTEFWRRPLAGRRRLDGGALRRVRARAPQPRPCGD
jgi:hypothetical protein